jgi:hypothetical protein
MEKDINLQVGLFLKEILLGKGAEVKMTRETDVAVGFSERADIANSWEADRLISIHHNAGPSNINGTEIWIDPYASEVTRVFAQRVQNQLLQELGLSNRGVQDDHSPRITVLKDSEMPAILTEASFHSNPEQEQLLRDPAYLRREAAAIARGLEADTRVAIASPSQRELLSGEQTVNLQVSDGVSAVQSATYSVDGDMVRTETTPPYAYNLDTTQLLDGQRSLQVDVQYKDGQTYSAAQDMLIANAATDWYFAEGTTRAGFDEYLTILNPNPGETPFTVLFYFSNGEYVPEQYVAEPYSRMTLPVNDIVGPDKDVSCRVQAERPLVVERPMYFTYRGAGTLRWQGGHDVLGANAPDYTWYFAEGYTGNGFEEYLSLFNPGDVKATVTVNYMPLDGKPITKKHEVAPHSRRTIFVNQDAGTGLELSVLLNSTNPIVAERPMYFNYGGKWQGGSNVMGVTDGSTAWYFAEGSTGTGFEEWLCLQNPGSTPAEAKITYMLGDGAPIPQTVVIPPFSRRTVSVNQQVGAGKEVSVEVISDLPIVAERAIYQAYRDWGVGGDVVMGASTPASDWFLAEGTTRPGFEEWLLIVNPTEVEVNAVVSFNGPPGTSITRSFSIKPKSRYTIYANEFFPSADVSISLHSSLPVVAERALYFIYGGQAGSTAGSGYSPGLVR